jgi:hypothetical protein
LGTREEDQQNTKTQHKHLKQCVDPTKTPWWTQVLAKGKQFLLLIRRQLGYSYIESYPVKALTVIEERKKIFVKRNCHLRYGYFVTVNQIVMTTWNFCSDDFNLGVT